jgi:hypothetical protein
MAQILKQAAFALVLPGAMLAAVPASAHDRDWGDDDRWEHRDNGHHRGWDERNRGGRDGYYGGGGYYGRDYYRDRVRYDEPVYRNTRVWRGNDGRYYCRRSDGTTGLLIGGVAGALLGREVAGYRGDRTAGAIIGGAIGALAGKAIDSNNSRCR